MGDIDQEKENKKKHKKSWRVDGSSIDECTEGRRWGKTPQPQPQLQAHRVLNICRRFHS